MLRRDLDDRDSGPTPEPKLASKAAITQLNAPIPTAELHAGSCLPVNQGTEPRQRDSAPSDEVLPCQPVKLAHSHSLPPKVRASSQCVLVDFRL